ncbi:glycosyltransferase [Solibacillus sp. MA9]|uniref:Glycosyltransferase n=1 Tax=Solibacillus palustris TaxID=2908203 RepID=A0ABS9UA22_9BACL|nr:glycosyltransferase [Solibacillus sp. MA9]MCH7321024.1 glycosyltransferase [Solibacillus sp. MA9]
MKIVQINSVCGIGSTGRIATDIHHTLTENRYKSYVAYGRDLPKNCENTIRIGSNYDNYLHVGLTRIFDKHGFGSEKATKAFIKNLEKINPDIIHLHNIHGYYINIEMLFNYIKKYNKRVIWTLHDCWAFTGHCSHFEFVGCNKWKLGCYDCPEKKEYPTSLFMDNSEMNFFKKKELFTGVKDLTIITPSKWLANLVKQSFLNEYPIKVIHNGINLNIFKPTSNNYFREKYKLMNKFIILGVANVWNAKKGLNHFIELSNYLEEDEVIVLVGLTEKQVKELPKQIIGITLTNSTKALAEIYSAADVFVNPTLEDNFPTTNIEALACGTPVFTFNSGGSSESIDETCGRIIVPKNTWGIKDCLKTYRTSKLINSSNCTNRANQYNMENQYNEYLNLYLMEGSDMQGLVPSI